MATESDERRQGGDHQRSELFNHHWNVSAPYNLNFSAQKLSGGGLSVAIRISGVFMLCRYLSRVSIRIFRGIYEPCQEKPRIVLQLFTAHVSGHVSFESVLPACGKRTVARGLVRDVELCAPPRIQRSNRLKGLRDTGRKRRLNERVQH